MNPKVELFLNILLILGALLAIFSIQGGQWITDMIYDLTGTEVYWDDIQLMRAAYSADTPVSVCVNGQVVAPGDQLNAAVVQSGGC